MSVEQPIQQMSEQGRVNDTQDATFLSVVRLFGLLGRVMQPYFARFGISGSQWGIMRVLYRAEGSGDASLRLTDLSERLLVRPPSVTSVVDRLQRMKLVSRDSSDKDHRVRKISLTSKGRELVERILSGHQAQIDKVLAGLNPAEKEELRRLMTQLNEHLEKLSEES